VDVDGSRPQRPVTNGPLHHSGHWWGRGTAAAASRVQLAVGELAEGLAHGEGPTEDPLDADAAASLIDGELVDNFLADDAADQGEWATSEVQSGHGSDAAKPVLGVLGAVVHGAALAAGLAGKAEDVVAARSGVRHAGAQTGHKDRRSHSHIVRLVRKLERFFRFGFGAKIIGELCR